MQVVLEKRPLNECSVVAVVVVVVMVVVVVVIVVVVVVKKIPVAPVTERSLSMSMDSWWGTKAMYSADINVRSYCIPKCGGYIS